MPLSAAPDTGLEASPKQQQRERALLSGSSPDKEMSSSGDLDSVAIVDFSPAWDYMAGGSKLLISLATATDFCVSKEDPLVYFGLHAAPAEFVSQTVLRCHVPPGPLGPTLEGIHRVPIRVVIPSCSSVECHPSSAAPYNPTVCSPRQIVMFEYRSPPESLDSLDGVQRLKRTTSNESMEEKAAWKPGKQEPAIRLQNGSSHWVSYTVLQEDKLKTKTVEKNVTDTLLASLNASFTEGAGARAEGSQSASVLTKQEGAPHFLMEDYRVRPSRVPGDAIYDVVGDTVPYPTGCKELRVLAYFQGRKAWKPYMNKVCKKKRRTTHVITAVDRQLDGYESSEGFFDTTAVSDGVDGDGLDDSDESDRISSTSVEEYASRDAEMGGNPSADEKYLELRKMVLSINQTRQRTSTLKLRVSMSIGIAVGLSIAATLELIIHFARRQRR